MQWKEIKDILGIHVKILSSVYKVTEGTGKQYKLQNIETQYGTGNYGDIKHFNNKIEQKEWEIYSTPNADYQIF